MTETQPVKAKAMRKPGVADGSQAQMKPRLENCPEGLSLPSLPLRNAFIFSCCRLASSIWMWTWPQTVPGSHLTLYHLRSLPLSSFKLEKIQENNSDCLGLKITCSSLWSESRVIPLATPIIKTQLEWGKDQQDRKMSKEKDNLRSPPKLTAKNKE